MQFNLGVYAHPIYVNGDYPEIMKTKVAEKSASQNYSKSRLPVFTETDINVNWMSVYSKVELH
jgi:lactase-phlorizin hydrolase